MSFDKLFQSFQYTSNSKKILRGANAVKEAIEDMELESVYTKNQYPKNLGLFEKKIFKDEDDIRSFKTFLFHLYPNLFFMIKPVNEDKIGIKLCKRVENVKCFIETIYIFNDDISTESVTSESSNENSIFESDNKSVTSDSSTESYKTIYAKESMYTYGKSEKIIKQEKEAKIQQAKIKTQEKDAQEKEAQEKDDQFKYKKQCAFFQTKNGCYKGSECTFKH